MPLKIFGWVFIALGLASIASVVAWAAFDLRWWVPIGAGEARGVGLIVIHVLSAAAMPPAFMVLATE